MVSHIDSETPDGQGGVHHTYSTIYSGLHHKEDADSDYEKGALDLEDGHMHRGHDLIHRAEEEKKRAEEEMAEEYEEAEGGVSTTKITVIISGSAHGGDH